MSSSRHPLHISGRRSPDEPPQHGINDGSGLSHLVRQSVAAVDLDGKAISRDASLTDVLISMNVTESRLIGALVALGEGEFLKDGLRMSLV